MVEYLLKKKIKQKGKKEMRRISKKIIAMALAGAIALGGMGITGAAMAPEAVQTASAASGHQRVGGGDWTWCSIPGVLARSSYYHSKKKHSASARVGTGKVVSKIGTAGDTAIATAYGVGTTYVSWKTY